jgi:hypothetical protein
MAAPRTASRLSPTTFVLALLVAASVAAGGASAGNGKGSGGAGKPGSKDTTPPTVAISAPGTGATLSGSVAVSGVASDNVRVAKVEVSVDGGAYQTASGTTSWSYMLDTAAYANGSHTLAAKATDTCGNTAATDETINVFNDLASPKVTITAPAAGATVGGSVSMTGTASDDTSVAKVEVSVDAGAYRIAQGTTSWTYSLDTTPLANGFHTLTARATDAAGNAATSSVTISVSNGLPAGIGQQLITPEGVTIQIASDVTNWTAQQIYDLLKPNAYELSRLGPTLTIKVQNQVATQTASGASWTGNPPVYSNFSATIYLKATNSAFETAPDAGIAHEYGCAWTQYHLWISHAGDWNPYLTERGLLGNPSLDSNLNWSRNELIADDYRMLFGTQAAQDEQADVNPYIADPRTVPGLKDWFVGYWAVP